GARRRHALADRLRAGGTAPGRGRWRPGPRARPRRVPAPGLRRHPREPPPIGGRGGPDRPRGVGAVSQVGGAALRPELGHRGSHVEGRYTSLSMDGNAIRETFLRFWEERGHRRVPSSSLIPPPESGLLLANAGMNQFIPYFLGQAEPPFLRATTAQKCFRANDIENVGHTARHMTFFEMLGNFSFGDYFKAEAAKWALRLVTEGYGIDADRLWATVFETDDEAADIWADHVGLPRERIVRRDKVDNYWWTHAAGPAGPCSEIYVDRGPRYGREGGPAVDEERFIEIWNLVFMQEEVDGDANIVQPLPKKNIDTGSGLERVAIVLQDVDNAFETDLLRPLLDV